MLKNTSVILVSSLMLAAIIALADCVTPSPPIPPPNPPIESVDAPVLQTTYQQLCNKLSDFGCAEGDDPGCAGVFERNEDNAASVSNLNVPCLIKAGSVEALKECKSVECKPKYETRRTNSGVTKCGTMACPP